jgi:(p)ppGpp synthase/HD superfamily hydrolase
MPQDRDFCRRFGVALRFANELHAPQTRKSTTIPYISHLMGVASLVLEHGGSADEAIAALLHDSVEDQAEDYPGGATALRAYIHDAFGPVVLEIINGCTDADSQPKPPWRERKERYVAHLATASSSIRLVSCADKLHNARAILSDLRSIGGDVFARFTAGREGTLWYYRQLADTFTALGPSLLAAELDRTVREIEALGR